MAKLDISVFSSKIIGIEVGPSRMVLYLHSGLLKLAGFLEANNQDADRSDSDSTERPIWIPEPVEDIFAYIGEYLYTGDYSVPLPHDVAPPFFEKKSLHAESDNAGKSKGNIFESLQSFQQVSDYIVRGIDPQPALPCNGGKHQYFYGWDYSEALLIHARLNHFAAQYELRELCDICLYKLLHMLREFPLHEGRVGDITTLIRFVFRDDQGDLQNASAIRGLMIHFTTYHGKFFLNSKEFHGILLEIPLFYRRFLVMLSEAL